VNPPIAKCRVGNKNEVLLFSHSGENIMRCAIALTFLFGLASTSFALPPLPQYLKEAVQDKADLKEFAAQVEALKSKCDVCHKPMADKKAKGHGLNDYGQAFHKNLDDKAFMAAHKEKKTADAMKLFSEAWTKTMENKNGEDKTFGSLIQAGKLPGKND
jgi:hypothetical protein